MLSSKLGQEELMYLSSFLSKKMKINFGKGPETCKSIVHQHTIYVHMRKFMTPAEEVLKKESRLNLAIDFRTAIIETIFQEYKVEVYRLLKIKLKAFHFDWDYERNQAFMMFVGESEKKKIENTTHEQVLLSEQIFDISSRVHIRLKEINIQKVNPNTYVAECTGAMCRFGKALLHKGLHDVLYEQSYEVKESYSAYLSNFEAVLDREIGEFYILWDYQHDKKYMVFLLK